MRKAWLVGMGTTVVLAHSVACSRRGDTPSPGAQPDAAIDTGAPITLHDAGGKRTVATRDDRDLLAMVPARIAVSSAVRNPRDFPEHLLDGDPNTAWNGKTGDLAGAWIAFRVPRDAHVDAVELTAGYARINGRDDLFTMNHRIAKLEVQRDGKTLTTAALDVAKRGMQRIPIGAEGGEFKLIVRATVPGNVASWREVVVSELRVEGTPGRERRAPGERLVVSIGSLDGTAPEPADTEISVDPIPAELRRPFASVAALCAAFLPWAREHAAAEIEEARMWNDAEPVAEPACEEVAVPNLEGASPPWLGAKGVHLAWGYKDATHVLAVTSEGVRTLPIYFHDRYGNGMGCSPVWTRDELDRLRVEHGWLIATIDGRGPVLYGAGAVPSGVAYQRGLAMCRMNGIVQRCLEVNPQYQTSFAFKRLGDSVLPADSAKSPWERLEEFVVADSGEISRLRVR